MKTHRRSGLCVFACSSVLLAGDSRFNRYKIPKSYAACLRKKGERNRIFVKNHLFHIDE